MLHTTGECLFICLSYVNRDVSTAITGSLYQAMRSLDNVSLM